MPARAGDVDLEAQVERAKQGDRAALEVVVEQVFARIYNLAIRMLWHPDDAEDATQEILIRVVTHLGSFRGESAFTTWVYRVASNTLLTLRKQRAEREELTFERFSEQLEQGLAPAVPNLANEVENRMLIEEVKLGCTHGMLLCLDRDQRLAYILGHVFGVSSREGGEIVGVSPATFRKRLSRARSRLHGFMARNCGLVNASNPCRCARRVDHAIRIGRVDPDHLLFAHRQAACQPDAATWVGVGEMERLYTAADLLRGHPRYSAPGSSIAAIRNLLDSAHLVILTESR